MLFIFYTYTCFLYRNYCDNDKAEHSLSSAYSLIKEALDSNNNKCDKVLAKAVAYDVNVTRAVTTDWFVDQLNK